MSVTLIIILIATLLAIYSCCKDKMATTKEIKEKAIIADLSESDRIEVKKIDSQIVNLKRQKEKIIGKPSEEPSFGESVLTKANKITRLI